VADQHARIAPTAYVTSYVWHRERFPHAELFTSPRGAFLYWLFRGLFETVPRLFVRSPTLHQALAYRHHLIDFAVERHEPDLLIEIAGGLSRRGATFAGRGVRTVEIDLPHMIAAKQERLEQADPELRAALDAHHTARALDVLSDGFADELAAVIGDAQRPVVVAEGLLVYFELAQRQQLLASLGAALAGRDAVFLFDAYVTLGAGRSVLNAAINIVTRGQGPRPGWASWDAVGAALTEAGFTTHGPVRADALPQERRPELTDERMPGRVIEARVSPA